MYQKTCHVRVSEGRERATKYDVMGEIFAEPFSYSNYYLHV